MESVQNQPENAEKLISKYTKFSIILKSSKLKFYNTEVSKAEVLQFVTKVRKSAII